MDSEETMMDNQDNDNDDDDGKDDDVRTINRQLEMQNESSSRSFR